MYPGVLLRNVESLIRYFVPERASWCSAEAREKGAPPSGALNGEIQARHLLVHIQARSDISRAFSLVPVAGPDLRRA